MFRLILTTAVLLSIGVCAVIPLAHAQMSEAKIKIQVENIGRSVVLIGRLRKPLGEKMTVRGRWALPSGVPKDNSPRFTVFEVNGKALAQPVEFNIEQLTAYTTEHRDALPDYDHRKSLDRQVWSMFAYETGRVAFKPNEELEKFPVFPVEQAAYYASAFTSELVAVVTSFHGEIKHR